MTTTSTADEDRPPLAWSVVLPVLAAKAVLHALALVNYGYFRDELYYLASTRHLAFGYVDHPPLSIAVLAAYTALAGDSLIALRLLPTLLGLAHVMLVALSAREMGGGRTAQGLAALAMVAAPVILGTQHIYSMNVLDHVFWAAAALLVARLVRRATTRTWIALGVILGLTLLNKLSGVWLAGGLAIALVTTPLRATLRSRGPWLAAGIALVVFLPHVLWQIAHGWPTLEFLRNAAERKFIRIGFVDFVANQALVMNPVAVCLWLGGLWFALAGGEGRRWRPMAWVFLTTFAFLAATRTAKAYYLSPAYAFLAPLGALAIERWTESRLRIVRPVLAAGLILFAAFVLPLAMPVLTVDGFLAYTRATGLEGAAEERHERAELPQQYADMFGWDEMAAKVARAYHALPPSERARCAVFAQNYGEAGAIDVLGRRLGLPRALSGHNSYWLWGPGRFTGEVVIILGGDPKKMAGQFQSLELVDVVTCARCMPYERNLPVSVGRGLMVPLSQLWPSLKGFI
jgi:Dolichyl-phosphate-mannose-protein mannosyltransferase